MADVNNARGDASMGPVILITGNALQGDQVGHVFSASMGPVILITGNKVKLTPEQAEIWRFNGAGDFDHRKLQGC